MALASHLKSFQALELAVRLGSLKKGADALGITPAAVGQRIKTLEDYLGVDLLVRGRSGLQPTAELSKALPHLGKAFAELGAAADALDLQRVNEIHIAANSDWVSLWLQPRLPEFRSAYPNISFCINGEGDAPIRLGQTDVEISFSEEKQNNNCDLLYHDYITPIGSTENILRLRKLRRRLKLEGFPLLHLDFYKEDPSSLDWPRWIKAFGHRSSGFERGVRFRQIAAGLEAVKSNAGFMLCGQALIADQVERGELALPFPVDHGGWTSHAFQAAYKHDTTRRAQVSRFREWLAQKAAETRNDLANRAPAP